MAHTLNEDNGDLPIDNWRELVPILTVLYEMINHDVYKQKQLLWRRSQTKLLQSLLLQCSQQRRLENNRFKIDAWIYLSSQKSTQYLKITNKIFLKIKKYFNHSLIRNECHIKQQKQKPRILSSYIYIRCLNSCVLLLCDIAFVSHNVAFVWKWMVVKSTNCSFNQFSDSFFYLVYHPFCF